jgi:hypothetical protein
MAITVVNGTTAENLEFIINGVTDGSGTPMWSGNLSPMEQPNSTLVMEVSGYETYTVAFFPVGWTGPNTAAMATSPEVTDNTIVALNIDVDSN